LEEAEEKMKAQKKLNDRWLMRAEQAAEGTSSSKDSTKVSSGRKKDEKPIKEWRQKLMGIGTGDKMKLQKGENLNVDDIGMDFDEGFSDDDEINFGIEDSEEVKEAQKRVFAKGVAGVQDEEEKETWNDTTVKVYVL
jgi:hypothetical protein